MIRNRSELAIPNILLCFMIFLSGCQTNDFDNATQKTSTVISIATHTLTATSTPTSSPTPLPQLFLMEDFGLALYDQPCLEGAYGVRYPCLRISETDNGDILSVVAQTNNCEWLSVASKSGNGWIPFYGDRISFSEPCKVVSSELLFDVNTCFNDLEGSTLLGANFEECHFPDIQIPDVVTSLSTMVLFGYEVIEPPPTFGYTLKIINESDKDVYIVLSRGLTKEIIQISPFEPPVYEQPVVGIYVKSGEKFKTGLESGFYTIYLSLGDGWSIKTGRFTANNSYLRTIERLEANCPMVTCSNKIDTLTIKGDYAGENLIPISASEFPQENHRENGY